MQQWVSLAPIVAAILNASAATINLITTIRRRGTACPPRRTADSRCPRARSASTRSPCQQQQVPRHGGAPQPRHAKLRASGPEN
jgi:hypothetical protein